MPIFLADECVSWQTVELLRTLGLTVERTQDIAGFGIEDAKVSEIAREKKAVLLT